VVDVEWSGELEASLFAIHEYPSAELQDTTGRRNRHLPHGLLALFTLRLSWACWRFLIFSINHIKSAGLLDKHFFCSFIEVSHALFDKAGAENLPAQLVEAITKNPGSLANQKVAVDIPKTI
jgi:hypothetical protein